MNTPRIANENHPPQRRNGAGAVSGWPTQDVADLGGRYIVMAKDKDCWSRVIDHATFDSAADEAMRLNADGIPCAIYRLFDVVKYRERIKLLKQRGAQMELDEI